MSKVLWYKVAKAVSKGCTLGKGQCNGLCCQEGGWGANWKHVLSCMLLHAL